MLYLSQQKEDLVISINHNVWDNMCFHLPNHTQSYCGNLNMWQLWFWWIGKVVKIFMSWQSLFFSYREVNNVPWSLFKWLKNINWRWWCKLTILIEISILFFYARHCVETLKIPSVYKLIWVMLMTFQYHYFIDIPLL